MSEIEHVGRLRCALYNTPQNERGGEQVFDAMKNELENDKAYLHTADGICVYFFLSFKSLYIFQDS
ncbi:MAG: hypothetical protein ACYCT2_08330 [Thermoplasmataceae archaeon]